MATATLENCDPALNTLRMLAKQESLLESHIANPSVVLDAIDEALDVVTELHELTWTAKFRGPRYWQNLARAKALAESTSETIGRISTKLKAQLDAQAAK